MMNRVVMAVCALACVMLFMPLRRAYAIDFYEIQVYPVETAPKGHLTIELHSNSVTTATGSLAKDEINPYQVHETVEATYGVLRWLEVGQYLATAKLDNGNYNYAGARSKVHFGIPQSKEWPVEVGANFELDYMRFAAEENPLSLEMRPILEKKFGRLTLIGNFAFEKPFSGPGNKGVDFSPSSEIDYQLLDWVAPGLEYYADMGPVAAMPSVDKQQHFVVPALNFLLLPQLELNLGVGIGLTRASNGLFLKSIVGWTF
jgi:hypothetical protein